MRRFFIQKNNIIDNKLVITGEEAHHIKDVIRLQAGDEFIGLDGEGLNYICRIINVKNSKIEAEILTQNKSSINIPDLVLACAIPKLDKMDFIIQKAAELRVNTVIPMHTNRTLVNLDAKKEQNRLKRWEKIAKESSKQCGRDNVLKIPGVMKFKEVLSDYKEYKLKLIPCLCNTTKPIKEVLNSKKADSVIILIGPEGDFTANEVEFAIANGFMPVSLGPSVLRVDTACIFAVSVVIYEKF